MREPKLSKLYQAMVIFNRETCLVGKSLDINEHLGQTFIDQQASLQCLSKTIQYMQPPWDIASTWLNMGRDQPRHDIAIPPWFLKGPRDLKPASTPRMRFLSTFQSFCRGGMGIFEETKTARFKMPKIYCTILVIACYSCIQLTNCIGQ